MKRFIKLIPMAFVALAIAGAFTTHAMSTSAKGVTANWQGYVKVNPLGTVCNTSIICSDFPNALCTIGTTQVWGKDGSGRCVVELYRIP